MLEKGWNDCIAVKDKLDFFQNGVISLVTLRTFQPMRYIKPIFWFTYSELF